MRYVMLQASRFLNAFLWLVGLTFRVYRRHIVYIIICSIVGVGMSAVAMALVILYVSSLETGDIVGPAGMALSSRSPYLLALVAAGAFLMLSAGFSLIFLAKRAIVAVAANLQVHLAGEVIAEFGGRVVQRHVYGNPHSLHGALYTLASSDARQAGIAARRLLSSIVPLCILATGAAALIWIEPLATAFLLLVMLVSLPVYYRINLAASRATRQFENLSTPLRRSGLRLLNRFSTRPIEGSGETFIRRYDEEEAFDRSATAFRERFAALARAEYVSQIMLTIMVCGLVFYLGFKALNGNLAWTAVLAYLFILRFGMAAFRQIFQAIATCARLYPPTHRLHYYLDPKMTPNDASAGKNAPLRVAGWRGGIFQKGRILRLPEKGCIGITGSLPLSRYSAGLYARYIAGRRPGRSAAMLRRIVLAVPPSAARRGNHAYSFPCVAARHTSREDVDIVLVETSTLQEYPEILQSIRNEHIPLLVVCNVGRPVRVTGLQMDTHICGSVDGVVIAAGDPAWIDGHWGSIEQRIAEFNAALIERHKGDEVPAMEDEA